MVHGDHSILICFLPSLVKDSCMDDKSSNGIPSSWLWDSGKMHLADVMDPRRVGSDSAVAEKHCYNIWYIFNQSLTISRVHNKQRSLWTLPQLFYKAYRCMTL